MISRRGQARHHSYMKFGGAVCLALITGVSAVSAQDAAKAPEAAKTATKAAEAAKAPELSPAFEQPNLKNSLGDFLSGRPLSERLRIKKTDDLLRPPFASKPVDSVKGLAAKIRAEELDVCNRVKAAQYLGTVDCKAYPEAQEILIKTMHEDKYELVRLAAAQALGVMLSSYSQEERIMMCDPNYCPSADCPMKKKGKYQAPWEKSDKRFLSGRDACRGCCNADVLNALAKTAYDINDEACCFEPSMRVRQAAANSLAVCGICCREQAMPFIDESTTAPPPTPVDPENPNKELPAPDNKKQENPNPEKTTENIGPQLQTQFAPHPTPEGAPAHLPELSALHGNCIVGLRDKQFHTTRADLWSIADNRIYFFSSEQAKAQFDADPASYSVQFCGSDPIEYLTSGKGVEGRYLRIIDGQLYLFKSKENYETFRNDPIGYTAKVDEALQQKIARNQ